MQFDSSASSSSGGFRFRASSLLSIKSIINVSSIRTKEKIVNMKPVDKWRWKVVPSKVTHAKKLLIRQIPATKKSIRTLHKFGVYIAYINCPFVHTHNSNLISIFSNQTFWLVTCNKLAEITLRYTLFTSGSHGIYH